MYIIPTVHPAALLRGGRPISDVIERDLAKANRISIEGVNQKENLVVCLPSSPLGVEGSVRCAVGWMEKWINEGSTVAVDVETSSLDFFNCRLYSIALSAEDGYNTAVAFTLVDYHTLPFEAESVLVDCLRRILASRRMAKLFHNMPYDYAVLRLKGFWLDGPLEDSMAYHFLVQPDIPHDLGWIGHTYLDVEPWKLSHDGQKMAFSRDPTELLIYNAKDALNTMKLRHPLREEMRTRQLPQELISYQMAFSQLASRMEIVGIPVNMEKRKHMGQVLLTRLEERLAAMRQWLSWPAFNPMNKSHAVVALYDRKYVGLVPSVYTEKTKQPSTKYEHIIDYMEHPFVKNFVAYVEGHHAYATQYRDASDDPKAPKAGSYFRAIRKDGRLHPQWNPCAQKGSRFSSKPNCFDEKTDILTEQGWVSFKTLAQMDERPRYMQYDIETGETSLTRGEFIERSLEIGEEVVKNGRRGHDVSLRVTTDHRVPIRVSHLQRWTTRTGWVPEEVQMTGLQPRDWNYHGTIEVRLAYELPEYKGRHFITLANSYASGTDSPPRVWVIILAAYVALGGGISRIKVDGAYWLGGRSQTKLQRLVQLLKLVHESVDWTYSAEQASDSLEWQVFMRECPLRTWIESVVGVKPRLGPWLLSWSSATLALFVEEVLYWNGPLDVLITYSSPYKENADWLQIAGVISGTRLFSTSRVAAKLEWSYKAKLALKEPRAKTLEIIQLKKPETFYCVTVPTGFVIVRRRGYVHISGNCQNQRLEDRDFFEAPPGRIFVGADKDQLELRLAAAFAGVRELVEEVNKPGGDPHRLAALNVYGDAFLQKTKLEQKRLRDAVKTTVYASLYRAGVKTVHQSIRKKKFLDPSLRAALTLEVVGHIYHSYFGKYVEIPMWHDMNYELANTRGYLEIPPLKRRRYFPIVPAPFTEVANWPIQCVVANCPIFLDDGMCRMGEFAEGVVAIGNGEVAPARHLAMGDQDAWEVNLLTGEAPIVCSSNHQWLMFGIPDLQYKQTDRLVPGDFICTPPIGRHAIEPIPFRTDPATTLQNADSLGDAAAYWLGGLLAGNSLGEMELNIGAEQMGTSSLQRAQAMGQDFYTFAGAMNWAPNEPEITKSGFVTVHFGLSASGVTAFESMLEGIGVKVEGLQHWRELPKGLMRLGRRRLWLLLKGFIDCGAGWPWTRWGFRPCYDYSPVYALRFQSPHVARALVSLFRFMGLPSMVRGPFIFDAWGHMTWQIDVLNFDVDVILYREKPQVRTMEPVDDNDDITPRERQPMSESDAVGTTWDVHNLRYPYDAQGRDGLFEPSATPAMLEELHKTFGNTYLRKHHRTVLTNIFTGSSIKMSRYIYVYRQAGVEPPIKFDGVRVKSVRPLNYKVGMHTLMVNHDAHTYCAQGLISANCSGSDIVGREMVEIQSELDRRFPGSYIIHHGHDALTIECPEKYAEAIKQLTNQIFGSTVIEGPAGTIRLTASAKIGKTLKEIK